MAFARDASQVAAAAATSPRSNRIRAVTSAETITVAHSPDSDDAFMFYALAEGRVDTEGLAFAHELSDIESLNRRAMAGELAVTAVSFHAYARLADRYLLLPHGASFGDGYGPVVVAREPDPARVDRRGARSSSPRRGPGRPRRSPSSSGRRASRMRPLAFDRIQEAVRVGRRARGPAHSRRAADVRETRG